MNKQFQAKAENRKSKIENPNSDRHGSGFRFSNLESPASPAHGITGSPGHPITSSPDQPITGRWKSYRLLLLARLKELYREPEVIFWVFGFPLLLALGLGIAFRDKPADVSRVALVAGPEAAQAMELFRAATAAGTVHVDLLPATEAFNQFRLGKVDLVVTPRAGGFEYLYDPARPESVLARSLTDDALQTAAGRKNRVPTSGRISSEPGARYIDFLIPGLLGMNLMNSGMWGIGFALVDLRQRKLLKRFVASPMRRGDFLLALASSRLILMLIELVLLLGFGVLAFHMRVAGSWASILIISSLGALCFGGVGLLTASRAQKIETVSGLINLVMMPMWILSGVFFSYERFPALLHPLIKVLPLTALNDALRAAILEGAPLTHQTARLLVLCLWGILSYLLALRWFRWT
ncbi:MAG: ABC transporter permease [Terriglobia bacterium]|jgi:ABC-type multidrug transport system permease subunit